MNYKRQYQQPQTDITVVVGGCLLDGLSTTLGSDVAQEEGRAGQASLWDEEDGNGPGNGVFSSGLDDNFN